MADFDLDGDPDVLIINATGPAQIWLNDGSGAFSAGPDLNPGRENIGRADVGDLDGDGDLDVWIIWPGGDRVFFNQKRHPAVLTDVSVGKRHDPRRRPRLAARIR